MNIPFIKPFFCSEELAQIVQDTKELSSLRTDILRKSALLNDLQQRYDLLTTQNQSVVENLSATTKKLQGIISGLQAEEQSLKAQLIDKTTALATLMARQDAGLALLPETTRQLLIEYQARYAEADISYTGRYLGNINKTYSLDLRAFALEGYNDRKIAERVGRGNAYVSDIMKAGYNFHRACDIAVMRVSNVFGCNYAFDSTTWNTAEFWMFASETEAYGKGDCDDMANWRQVGCRVAGIPKEMLRIAAGTTFTNEGHCTNFYFGSDLHWHHINSTSNYGASVDVRILPKPQDTSDPLNLREVWFSFNEQSAWHELVTDSAVASFGKKKSRSLLKNFKIISR